jgi:hypothetical protein
VPHRRDGSNDWLGVRFCINKFPGGHQPTLNEGKDRHAGEYGRGLVFRLGRKTQAAAWQFVCILGIKNLLFSQASGLRPPVYGREQLLNK